MCAGLRGPARKSGGRATGMSVEAFGFFPQWRLPVGTTRSGRLDFFDGPPSGVEHCGSFLCAPRRIKTGSPRQK